MNYCGGSDVFSQSPTLFSILNCLNESFNGLSVNDVFSEFYELLETKNFC